MYVQIVYFGSRKRFIKVGGNVVSSDLGAGGLMTGSGNKLSVIG